MFKKLINRIRGARAMDTSALDPMPEFTMEHCVSALCQLANDNRHKYDEATFSSAMAETAILSVNKQRELRGLPATDANSIRSLYHQANGNIQLFAHLVYETAIGHR